MPPRPDTPHDRPVKGPKWVSPWGFDDEWEDEQRRHAEAARPRETAPPASAKEKPKEAPPATVAAPVSEPPAKAPDARTVAARPVTTPAIVSLREEGPLPPMTAEAESKKEISKPAAGQPAAAPVSVPASVAPELDLRLRPPAEQPHAVPPPAAPAPEKIKRAAPPAADETPRDPPTQKRPAPVPNSVRRSRPASVFPWSTVFTAVLGMAGIFLLGSIYFIDVPPAADDDLALNVSLDTTPKIAGPERLRTFLQAVNTLADMELAMRPAWKWDEGILQSFMQGNGAALDTLRDLLGDFDWHPHHSAWHLEDLGEHRSWPHVRILLQARVAWLMRTGQERPALEAALDIGRLSRRLQEMWSWPSYAHRAQEMHMACVQSTAQVLKDTRLSSAELKTCQDAFVGLMPSDEFLQGALNGFYLHEKKLLFGENSGEPLDTMPGGVLSGRPGRLFFKKQETLGLFANACRHMRDLVVEAPFSVGTAARLSWVKPASSLWFQPNGAGQTYFAAQVHAAYDLPERHHLARTRHFLVLTLFAVRRHLVDHQKLPSGLTDLRPGYLAEIPLDPYSGEWLRYDPLKGVLFSAGDDFRAQDGHITDPPLVDTAEPTVELGIAIATPVQASQ